MSNKDLTKEVLYEGVKQIIDCDQPHIHLTQQKLYTLFSLAFNYFLFNSAKDPGHYIIRVENSFLLEKLIKKSKDESSRKFLQKMALPRRLKYNGSMFHLDFFHFSSWSQTNEIPKSKLKGALIVKNATKSPIGHSFEEDEEMQEALAALPKNYYLSSIQEFMPKTITIAYEEELDNVHEIRFPFIKEEENEKLIKGVNIASDVDLSDLS